MKVEVRITVRSLPEHLMESHHRLPKEHRHIGLVGPVRVELNEVPTWPGRDADTALEPEIESAFARGLRSLDAGVLDAREQSEPPPSPVETKRALDQHQRPIRLRAGADGNTTV